ncbi:MAG: hypothetical protein O3A20_06550 [Planctomycetota bacterium]|nr:hypothetical protein [Planctomycetota bacterium]
MMKMIPPLLFGVGTALLLTATATAAQPLQDGPPGAKPVQAEAAKTAEKTAKQAGEKAEQAEPAGEAAKRGSHARDNREVLEPVAFEQARYVKRCAQLERIKQIAAEKNNEKLSQQAEELVLKNDGHHTARLAELRTKHGDEQVTAALAWIETRSKERSGAGVVKAAKDKQKETGSAVDKKTKENAKDKKEKTDEMKEKAKQKVKGEAKP